MTKKPPAYRQRPGYTQAIVTLTDARTKKRRDYWLGEHGSPDSREMYHRLLAEWEARGRRLPELTPAASRATAGAGADEVGVSVLQLIREYWRFASGYYSRDERANLRGVLRLLKQHYGRTPAAEFGPVKLRTLREVMVRGDSFATPPRRPWTRRYVNQQAQRITRMFRWGVSRELVPPAVHAALKTVEALKRGRCAAREGKRVAPVPADILDTVRPFLSRPVRALVDLQLLTGARPGELLALRAVDLDTGSPDGVWRYMPVEHKNALRGIDRVICLGPAAQKVLRPFLAERPVDASLFSPADAERDRRAAAAAARSTPLSCGNRAGTNRVVRRSKEPGDRYTTPSYRRAIEYACDRAFPPPAHLRPRPMASGRHETLKEFSARLTAAERAELKAWRRAHRFHPHQLRHNAATEIRRRFGLEAAQLMLGHSSALVTEAVYAERDTAKAAEVARAIG